MLPENKSALLTLVKDVHLSPEQEAQTAAYVDLIEQWNARTNLVSRQDLQRLVSRHVRESLWFCDPPLLEGARRILDLGSGAGFPGIPIKIVTPEPEMTLLDSRRMKALFLEEAVKSLGLARTRVLCQRAEALPALDPQLRFDLVVCRAVARLRELWDWCAPLLRPRGRLAALKGGDLAAEIDQLLHHRSGVACSTLPMPELPDDPTAGRQMIVVYKP